jgi:HK97 gp10 family phage protein
MASGAHWSGLTELNRAIDALPAKAKAAIKATTEKTGQEMAKRVTAAMPTGPDAPHAKNTVRVERGRTELSVDVIVGDDGSPYWPHVEFGHMTENGVHVPPQPVFYPAARIFRRRYRNRMSRLFRKLVKDELGLS